MILYSDKLDRADLDYIADGLGMQLAQAGEFGGARRRRIAFVLRPIETKMLDSRYQVLSRHPWSKWGGSPVWAVNWEGHYDFMDQVFKLDPEAEIKSSLAHWRGREDFLARAHVRNDAYGGGTLNRNTSGGERSGVRFATLQLVDGKPQESNVKVVRHSDIAACPHVIFSPEHYRADGSCKCDDPADLGMAEWGYEWDGRRWAAPYEAD